MNQIFDIQRFIRSNKLNFSANQNKLLRNLIQIAICYVSIPILVKLFYFLGIGIDHLGQTYTEGMLIIIIISLLGSASNYYGYINDRKKGIQFTMTPVSKLEKFLYTQLYLLVVIPVCVGLTIILCDTLLYVSTLKTSIFSYSNIRIFDYFSFTDYISLMGIFSLGNVYCQKGKIIKPILFTLAITMVLSAIATALGYIFFEIAQITKDQVTELLNELHLSIDMLSIIFNIIITFLIYYFLYRKMSKLQY